MRRYDIDWLRVITIGLLLIYHIAIAFQPWGLMIGFITNLESWETLWWPMAMLNVWRIPILFFVSGMGVFFAIRKRNWKQLIKERSLRIFIPFLFGILAITPIHVLLLTQYYNWPSGWVVNQGHLWFLLNIFIYVVILSPLFFYFKKNEDNRFFRLLKRILKSPFGLLPVVACFVAETLLINPPIHTLYAQTIHGYILGFICFFFGYSFVMSGDIFWKHVLKYRWTYLGIALSLYLIRLIVFKLEAPNYYEAIESCMWIFGIFGSAYKNLNKASSTLTYLSKAAYPIYIIHMATLYLASYFILPMTILPIAKFLIITGVTFAICFIIYEFLIRRIRYIRPLFGLQYSTGKNKQKD